MRLNNLSQLDHHPLKQYLDAGVYCVQGTDGGALYGTDPLDEQLSLERMLSLEEKDFLRMRTAEDAIIRQSMREFAQKQECFRSDCPYGDITAFYQARIEQDALDFLDVRSSDRRYRSNTVLRDQVRELPADRIPIVIVGGSFNHAGRITRVKEQDCRILDALMRKADPDRVFFVIGPLLTGYERYIAEHARPKFDVFAFAPADITQGEYKKLQSSGLPVRISIESAVLGLYKSIAYEIFKRRQSIIIALDGNNAADNLIQEAKNSKYKSRTFIGNHSRALRAKANSLQGYVTLL